MTLPPVLGALFFRLVVNASGTFREYLQTHGFVTPSTPEWLQPKPVYGNKLFEPVYRISVVLESFLLQHLTPVLQTLLNALEPGQTVGWFMLFIIMLFAVALSASERTRDSLLWCYTYVPAIRADAPLVALAEVSPENVKMVSHENPDSQCRVFMAEIPFGGFWVIEVLMGWLVQRTSLPVIVPPVNHFIFFTRTTIALNWSVYQVTAGLS